jgi:aromatic-L-amino-acid decarboxylase
VAAEPSLEPVCPTPWSLVCLRHRDGDAATQAIIDRVNASGTCFVSHTRVEGRLVMRVSIGAPAVAARHVDALWDLIRGGR